MEQLIRLYTSWKGCAPYSTEKLAGAGSNRQYYRLCAEDGTSVVGVVGTSKEENLAFVTIAKHFLNAGLPVPKVMAVADDGLRYIQQDLGSRQLFDALKAGREADGQYSGEEKTLLKRTISMLPKLQVMGGKDMDFSVCYPQPEFDADNVMFDLNYFKYCFLKATGVDFHEMKLEEDFRQLAADLTSGVQDATSGATFMYRDFQARNVMLDAEGNPYFIDFQGGRKGPYYYDVASFLWQASALYSDELRAELISEYYDALSLLTDVPERQEFDSRLQLFVLFRTLQVLGAYGFRGYFERKKHFIDSIPPAISNLRKVLSANSFDYPTLTDVLNRMCALPQFMQTAAQKGQASVSKYDGQGPLVVRVFSFSYKKGIPEDTSGNGGGYVFDCRSTHNPGRYEPYKKLTGLDAPVIKFLEDDGEILTFLQSVYELADKHVERYIQRGFTSLMFSFGCTGGQHRSVYSAQHLAEHLNSKYGIRVEINHVQQGISQTLTEKQ